MGAHGWAGRADNNRPDEPLEVLRKGDPVVLQPGHPIQRLWHKATRPAHRTLYSKSKERGSDKDYGTIHERNVIEFREQSTARKHGEIDNSQVTRRNHKISMVKGDVANKTPQEIETIVRSNNELL